MHDTMPLRPHQRIKAEISIPYHHVFELFSARAKKAPDKTLLFCPGESEDVFSYQELHDACLAVSCYLKAKGLKKRDRICLILPNSPEFVLFYFAALQRGITVVPINPDLAPAEMLYIIRNCRAEAVFCDRPFGHKLSEIESSIGKDVLVKKVGRLPDFEPLSEGKVESKAPDHDSLPAVNASDEAVIIYTSGTTGNPKGVVLTHGNLLADAQAISQWFRFSSETRTLCILPLFHNNGQIVTLLAPLYAGGSTVIVKGKASLMSFWGLVKKYGISWTSVMPSILSILLSLPVGREDSTMRGIICGGQVLTETVQSDFEKRFRVAVFEGYGLTETTSFACFNEYPAEKRKRGSVGRPLPINEMAILNEEGKEQEPHHEGEICVRGLNVANEYFDMPEKNRAAFRDGWFHSGDFGYKDEEGYYYFRTRKDHLIIKGGENIYPGELENVLCRHPSVSECAVIGIPDRLLGEDLCAFVKAKEGSNVTEQELREFCRGRIAHFKQAKRIILISETDLEDIPKGPTKKVLYRVLQEYYEKNIHGK